MANPAPIPWNSPIVEIDPRTRQPFPGMGISKDFGNWLSTSLVTPIANAPQFYPVTTLTNQSASIATTPLSLPTLASGAYRISYYSRITSVDPVSSSLTVTISWTESSVSLSSSGSAMTGNLTTTVQSGTLYVLVDASSALSYATTYASNTPGAAKYRLSIRVESV